MFNCWKYNMKRAIKSLKNSGLGLILVLIIFDILVKSL
jgi:hypothetical protein